MADPRTQYRNYPKPSPSNLLATDVLRLADSLDQVDGDVNTSLTVGSANTAAISGLKANPVFTGNGSVPDITDLATSDGKIPNTRFVQAVKDRVNVITPTAGSSIDNWSPTGLRDANIISFTPAISLGITGIVAPATAKVITLFNNSGDRVVWLSHENSKSIAANRFSLPDSRTMFLMPRDSITLWYNPTLSRWSFQSSSFGLLANMSAFEDYTGASLSLSAGGATIREDPTATPMGQRHSNGSLSSIGANDGFTFMPLGGDGANIVISSDLPIELLYLARIRHPWAMTDTNFLISGAGLSTSGFVNLIGWGIWGVTPTWVCRNNLIDSAFTLGPPVTGNWITVGFYLTNGCTRCDCFTSTDLLENDFTLWGSFTPVIAGLSYSVLTHCIFLSGLNEYLVDWQGFRRGNSNRVSTNFSPSEINKNPPNFLDSFSGV